MYGILSQLEFELQLLFGITAIFVIRIIGLLARTHQIVADPNVNSIANYIDWQLSPQ